MTASTPLNKVYVLMLEHSREPNELHGVFTSIDAVHTYISSTRDLTSPHSGQWTLYLCTLDGDSDEIWSWFYKCNPARHEMPQESLV